MFIDPPLDHTSGELDGALLPVSQVWGLGTPVQRLYWNQQEPKQLCKQQMDVTVDTCRSPSPRGAFSHGSLVLGRYAVDRKLGSGAFASAYLVTDARSRGEESQKVLKRIPCEGLRPEATLPSAREAKLLGSLNHPFIVRFLSSFLDGEDFCIITEYCEGGDLQSQIQEQRERGRRFPEGHAMEWFIQLLLGVNYLHERLVLHRDLKTKNIFLKNGAVKIGDFGVSRVLSVSSDMATTFTGTPHYMSPEAFTHSGYNAKSDIWSLGCILYEICALRRAFEAPNWMKLASLIVQAPSPPLPTGYSAALNDILQRQEKPRLDSLDAMRHVQEMSPRQRRRIRKEEPRETYMMKMKRAVDRLYQENQQRMEQRRSGEAQGEEDPWQEDTLHLATGFETDTRSDSEEGSEEDSFSGSVLTISMPRSEEQNSTLCAYQSCLQRILDSNTEAPGAGIRDTLPGDSEDESVSVCNKSEITRLRQVCVGLLGEDGFWNIYVYLKQVYYQQDSATEGSQEQALCEPQEMRLYPQHCWKVQQLLFLEERLEDELLGPHLAWL
ncbi:serine/threonine-protein kinase Nek11-like isoform X2 [Ascaphus truei]|uniref:serine/threonine-protein kinase Nek11-like isoform X2 n=1 Tax=Ascaphus truei TaxID=8439 RepID=UPI003F597CD7